MSLNRQNFLQEGWLKEGNFLKIGWEMELEWALFVA
jgi:hypothetical protein